MKKKFQICVAKRNGMNRWGARKYAEVPSRTRPEIHHIVAKFRQRGTRNYKYICTCEDFTFRQKLCDHIREFKVKEKALI